MGCPGTTEQGKTWTQHTLGDCTSRQSPVRWSHRETNSRSFQTIASLETVSRAVSSIRTNTIHLRHSRTRHTRAKLCASQKRSGPEHTGTGTKMWLGKSEISDEQVCGCSGGATRHRTVGRQPLAARWRLDLLDELRGTPWELKPGSPRSAFGLLHTSFAIPPRKLQQVEPAVLPELAGEDMDTRITEGEPLTAPIRKLHLTEKYWPAHMEGHVVKATSTHQQTSSSFSFLQRGSSSQVKDPC